MEGTHLAADPELTLSVQRRKWRAFLGLGIALSFGCILGLIGTVAGMLPAEIQSVTLFA